MNKFPIREFSQADVFLESRNGSVSIGEIDSRRYGRCLIAVLRCSVESKAMDEDPHASAVAHKMLVELVSLEQYILREYERNSRL